jgi:ABC-type antimicrobial peptide transport system permease subunit
MRFFRWFCRPELKTYIEGDLVELYNERLNNKGRRSADVHFVFDVLLLFRPSIIKSFRGLQPVNNPAMIKSYFTIGWRNLLRNKGYSIINIGGLALGMVIAILIGLWVYDEVSYDKNFKNYTRIAQVMQNQTFDGKIETWGSQAMQLGVELRSNYSNYFDHVIISTFPSGHKLTVNSKTINMTGSFAEPAIADMLALDMVQGTHTSLKDINGIMLSRSAARALFGEDDPINKIIRVDHEFDVTVTGIYEDLPENCSFAEYDVLLSWQIIGPAMEQRVGWGNSWFRCLVQLRENVSLSVASQGIKDAKLRRVKQVDDDARFKPELFLHPMSRWHLYSEFDNGIYAGGGQIQYVRMLLLVGIFVLFLACINFMNLSTARSEQRAKEVGIRKSIGSLRIQLISQFFSESLLVALLAFIFSVIIVQGALPWFNEITGKNIAILWDSLWFWIACTGFAVVTGFISGTYPALFLSSFQPVKVLKGTFKAGRNASLPRKVLVVVQFTVSVTLIISTVIVLKQIRFAQSRPIGYSINGIVTVPIRDAVVMKHYDVLRDELLKTGVVEEVAASESAITATFTTNSGFDWYGKDPNRTEEFVTTGITHEFGKTIGWKIKAGRDFSRDIASDSSGFIINETAAKYLGMKEPLGETMKWGENGEWKIIGIVEDLITQSPYYSVKPMIFFLESNRIAWVQFNLVNMRLRGDANAAQALSKITPIFKKYDADNAVEYMFADQEFGKKFDDEKRIGNLAMVSTILATVISCLGLFGLASFVASQRTKEIGIRKILGASVPQLWKLLSKDFVTLVGISCVVSVPFSLYFMTDWLLQYDYRIAISWQIYAVAWLGAISVTLLTISFQSLKAALNNPVSALRSE